MLKGAAPTKSGSFSLHIFLHIFLHINLSFLYLHRQLSASIPRQSSYAFSIFSSIRRSWLYFAVRSPRHGAPVLISSVPIPAAKSAMVLSSVSPERWDIIVVYPFSFASCTASMVSVSVPIWFGLIKIALAQ